MTTFLYYYLIIINVCTFFAFGVDKAKARRSKWRIPESTLLALAALGGSVGAFIGMKTWHHKTRHKKFAILIPLLIIVHTSLIFWKSL